MQVVLKTNIIITEQCVMIIKEVEYNILKILSWFFIYNSDNLSVWDNCLLNIMSNLPT